MSTFLVELEVIREDRYAPLVRVVEALRVAKQEDVWPDDDLWLTFSDAEARAHLWWPTPTDWAEHHRRARWWSPELSGVVAVSAEGVVALTLPGERGVPSPPGLHQNPRPRALPQTTGPPYSPSRPNSRIEPFRREVSPKR